MHPIKPLALLTLVLLSAACASPAVPATDPALPACLAASYEAGGDHAACGESQDNPTVIECDRPADVATVQKYAAAQQTCVPGALADTWCCADSVVLSEKLKCDQAAAIESFRAAHDELGKIGEWVVSPDCVVTQVYPVLTN